MVRDGDREVFEPILMFLISNLRSQISYLRYGIPGFESQISDLLFEI